MHLMKELFFEGNYFVEYLNIQLIILENTNLYLTSPYYLANKYTICVFVL